MNRRGFLQGALAFLGLATTATAKSIQRLSPWRRINSRVITEIRRIPLESREYIQAKLVPLSAIKVDYSMSLRMQPRHNDEGINALKKSIMEVGLISPLCITEEYQLVSGFRRYEALKELGVEEARCIVVSGRDHAVIIWQPKRPLQR